MRMSVILSAVVLSLFYYAQLMAMPAIESWNNKNGARVFFVKAEQIPLVDIRVIFNAGSARDQQKPGLAVLTNRMLTMGADGMSAGQLAEAFDSIGAKLGHGALRDSAWLAVRSLNKPALLNKASAALIKILTSPDFNLPDLERERQRALIGLQQRQQSPGFIAKKRFYQEIYADHPYANLPEGTIDGLKSIVKEDLLEFYQTYYVASNATIVIVGAISKQQAIVMADNLTEKLQVGKAAAPLPAVKPVEKAKVIKISHPSTQTHILMGQHGVARGDKDYFALYLANHALGGSGLVSKLAKEVREKRGMSYSVYSYFSPMRKAGPFIIGMQTRNDKAEAGVKVLQETVADYLKQGMTAEELKASKKNITGGFPLRIDTNSKISQYLGMIGFYQLPITYLQDFNKKIMQQSLKDVNTAFREKIDPKKFITVIVGG